MVVQGASFHPDGCVFKMFDKIGTDFMNLEREIKSSSLGEG